MKSASWWLFPLIAGPMWSFGAGLFDVAQHSLPGSSSVIWRARIDLPIEGIWELQRASGDAVRQLYLLPPPEALERQLGQRSTAALRENRIDQARWRVRMLYDPCLEFARRNKGTGPAAIRDLDAQEHRYLIDQLEQVPWWDWDQTTEGEPPAGPFVFLVPQARFHFADADPARVPSERREVLAFELRPYVDDGRHWVLYTDGSCVREPVLEDRVQQYGIQIRPVLAGAGEAIGAAPPTLPYTLVAVRPRSSSDTFRVLLRNPVTGAEQSVEWSVGSAPEDSGVLEALRAARHYAWGPYLLTGPAPILRTWLAATQPADSGASDPPQSVSTFALLGGRAAVEETLQLQNLRPREAAGPADVPVASLPGVTVQSHPFAEMLGAQPGGRLELAEWAPPDRLFLYVAQPTAILPFLEQGADFLAAAGTGLTGNHLDYGLTDRYLTRLGMTRPWLEAVVRSGLIRDLALMLPDLFLIDGTDVTVVVRLHRPELFTRFLSMLGVKGLEAGSVLPVTTPAGRPAYWSLQGDRLCIGTHRAELERLLKFVQLRGEGSLGQTAEFRYMLTQMPMKPETRFLVYFSDPFIRRLVGPQVKLGQLRRLRARAQMETVAAQALLALADGMPRQATLAQLIQWGYLPADFPADDVTLEDADIVRSGTYGTVGGMKTLLEVPVAQVTSEEAEAYRRYVENYSRFWSRFFDPIAVRLDDAEGALELSTFILPLIENSIYDGLRETLLRAEDRQPLVLPTVDPTPVLQLSLNLQDRVWQSVAGGFGDLFRQYGGVTPALLDDLGPALHLSVFDADPVLALGSGDLLGAFGGPTGMGLGRSEMLIVPVALSVLTRPCTLRVETRDPERTARYLRQAATTRLAERRGSDDLVVTFHQIENREAWVWSLSVGGMIKLRFGLEVTDRHLVLRNLPWSATDRVRGLEPAPQNGAGLSLWPGACQLQLPSLFASAADQQRQATLAGLGRLYPLLVSGAADVEAATEWHRRLFGFWPVPRPTDRWNWEDGQLASAQYGSALRQRQPAYAADRPFGLLHSIESLRLTMQFEDAGLRSTLRWKPRR